MDEPEPGPATDDADDATEATDTTDTAVLLDEDAPVGPIGPTDPTDPIEDSAAGTGTGACPTGSDLGHDGDRPASNGPLLASIGQGPDEDAVCVRIEQDPVTGDTLYAMLSGDDLLYLEGDTLVTRDLTTGNEERTGLGKSVAAALGYGIEHYAGANLDYTADSKLFTWFLGALRKLWASEEDVTAVNKYLRFLQCGFTILPVPGKPGAVGADGQGYAAIPGPEGCGKMTITEAFKKLSVTRA